MPGGDHHEQPAEPLGLGLVGRTWWPLAVSWLMMSLEMPAISAAVARLPDPEVHLAAFGGLVFPLALLIEAPIIMMLAASTALSRDQESFRRLRRFMITASVTLTAVHALVAFTPLYDWIALSVIGAPPETVEPGRLGLRLMLLWTWAIADRRFHQGVLIRFGRSGAVGAGTMVRLAATCTALLAGYLVERIPGIAVAAGALAIGVLVEAAWVRLAVAPVIRGPLAAAPPATTPLGARRLLAFYVPLALTPLLGLLGQPIGAAAISRMPDPLLALAAWPALNGLVFLTRSLGIAYNEVMVSLGDRPGAIATLRRFAALLGAATMGALLVMSVTPLGAIWFARICGLGPELTTLATAALWLGILLPGLGVVQSFYMGILVNAHRTRGIPESMGLLLITIVAIFAGGVALDRFSGLAVSLVAFTVGGMVQCAWLAFRARPHLRALEAPPDACSAGATA